MLVVTASCAVFLYFFMRARFDAKLAGVDQAAATTSACAGLRLGMTRQDVDRVMGPTSRVFQTEGPSGGEAVALHFETPMKEERYPMVVLQGERVVETICSASRRVTATTEQIEAMFAQERAQDSTIGADDQRR